MSATEQKLKPCPFCGSDQVSKSEGKHADGSPWFYIECENCDAVAEPEMWNRRAPTGATHE
jgi:transcription elongation factor Elf1